MKKAEREQRPGAGAPGGSAVDVQAMDADVLRDAVREGLTTLSEDDFAFIRDRLLEDLERAGLNIGGCLFLIGYVIDLRDAITPTDLAQLVRYVRLNRPGALGGMQAQLERLVSFANRNRKQNMSRRAA